MGLAEILHGIKAQLDRVGIGGGVITSDQIRGPVEQLVQRVTEVNKKLRKLNKYQTTFILSLMNKYNC